MHHPNNSNKKRNRRRRSDSHGSASSAFSASSLSEGEGHSCPGSPPPHSKGNQHPDKNNANNANNKCRRSGGRKRRQRSRKRGKGQQTLPEESKFLALDCEMVGIGENGHTSSIARVTVVDWDGNALFDEYIQQDQPVTDYRTFVSGITPQDLEDATLSLEECRNMVLQLLQNHILVGHALKNDLKALDISHPWWLTRDTAKFEPFMKVRFDDGILWPRKLKELVSEKLHQEIQIEGKPHSPYEDALAALDLYRSVRPK
eukprot:CAMPEP_0113640844 /NCGR_PEP_ID=MMETSP0017_2-20120614/21437_1 /TAXON_ID=2856 /ORGANISM="Cylindrotheca closterium" /LENGTH=258 /DNA_ID=CAMNT_0000552147 /DNA_START=139 /DNA_END=912 /DNA_ORIENTATION=+ /assembly_acc=CAM_ASM_000147